MSCIFSSRRDNFVYETRTSGQESPVVPDTTWRNLKETESDDGVRLGSQMGVSCMQEVGD